MCKLCLTTCDSVVPYFPGLYYWDKNEIALGSDVGREHRFFGLLGAPTVETNSVKDLFMFRSFYPTQKVETSKDTAKLPAVSNEEDSLEETGKKLQVLVEKKRKLLSQQKEQENVLKKKKKNESARARIKQKLG